METSSTQTPPSDHQLMPPPPMAQAQEPVTVQTPWTSVKEPVVSPVAPSVQSTESGSSRIAIRILVAVIFVLLGYYVGDKMHALYN